MPAKKGKLSKGPDRQEKARKAKPQSSSKPEVRHLGSDVARSGSYWVQKGTRRLAFREVNLSGSSTDESFDVDISESTKVRIALTVNGSSRKVTVALTSKLLGAASGSFLDRFDTSLAASRRTRVYELPGEELGIRISQSGGSHQVFVTVWGD